MNDSVKYFFKHGYAWPGGYPIYGVMEDGECLCKKCTEENKQLITENTNCKLSECTDTQWRMIDAQVNYESNDLYCNNCNSKIESAYGNDETD